jgi:hypothetical protein
VFRRPIREAPLCFIVLPLTLARAVESGPRPFGANRCAALTFIWFRRLATGEITPSNACIVVDVTGGS